MGSVRLGVGTEWLLDGRALRVVRQTAPDTFVALDLRFHTEEAFTEERLLALYAEGRLRFATGSAEPDSATTSTRTQVVHDLTPAQRDALRRRWRAIEPLTNLAHTPTAEDFRRRAGVLSQRGSSVSARSLRRWWKAWLGAGRDRRALVPATGRRGGRGRSRRTGLLERYSLLRQLVDEAIQNVYLTTARRSIAAVTRRVFDDLARRNARLPADQAVPLPKQGTLARAVARRIARLDPWEVDRARWGRRIADRRHAPTSRQRLARRVLERVEIDHSPLKVVVGNEAGPIGQPWLTVLVDYHSRMVTGFCLGFEPPSHAVVMEALRHAILPKTYLAEAYPRVQGTWPCFGLPEKLVCDRGPDLTSRDLERAAFQLGIELDFNPPRTPHFKGTVESFFDVLNDQLASSLPGRTFRSWERRADHDPDAGPLLPYEALLEVLHVHLVDVYARQKHPTRGESRLDVWRESAAEEPPCLPGSPDDLVVLLARSVERTLSSRGIELGGMFYTSDELMALRPELAATNLDAGRLQIRYNPWDLGEVWVLNPLTQAYLRATAVDDALRGMTEYQWRVLKRAIRERFDDPDHLLSLAAGRNAIREVVEETLRNPSRRRRVRAARFLGPPPRMDGRGSDEDWVAVPNDATSESPTPVPESPPPSDESPSPVSEPSSSCDDQDSDDLDVDDWDVAC